jgi:superfamily II DNA or RNA helicase/DNA-directed RNA polymerase subunit H (RpoH/RPB5)
MNNIEKGFNYEKQIKKSIIENTNHNAYLWNECPETILIENNLIKSPEHNKNIRKAIKEGTLHNHKDIGIDIIQVDSNNSCVAIIQCKNGYLNGVCIKDIAGIMTRSAFNKLLPSIIYYTDKLSNNLNMLIDLNTNVYKTDFSNINYETNNIYFIKEPYITTNKISTDNIPIIFTPYEYQLDAVSKIIDNFTITNRSILAIPCGCGKTYISYLISLKYKKIIIISPLIEFACQNLLRYIEYGYDENNTILINSDGIRDIDIIKTKIKENEKLLISSTFKSMDIINKCLDLFDEDTLFIIDEFHNLSKNNISDKDDDIYKLLITNHKILFMSATPRIYDIEYLDDEDISAENEEIYNDDSDEENSIIDYDNKFDELFGKIVYNISLTDAIINNYITDYKIWLPSIHENKEQLNKELSIYDIDNDIKNRCEYLFSCLSNNGSRKTIIYCKDTNDMNNMIDSFNLLNDFYNLDIDIYSISCENSNKERKNILKSFSENDFKIQLLFNIKILNECINIPSCDSIYISYPPKNKITTIQRINRATRINKNNPFKIANIYIWCDEYEEILETLSSIKEYDIMFKDKIKINAAIFYNNRNEIDIKIINEDIETLNKYVIGVKEFKCLTWNEKLELLEKYIIENDKLPSSKSNDKYIKNIGIWIGNQKRNYKNKKEIMKNEEIRKKWDEFICKNINLFKTNIELWYDKFKLVEDYIIKYNKLPSQYDKDNNTKILGIWIASQKSKYKNNIQIMKNEEIKKQWKEFIEKYINLFKTNIEIWNENLIKLEEYIIKYNKLPSQIEKDINNKKLGGWLSQQNERYKNNDRCMKNENFKNQWEEFIKKYSHLFKTRNEYWNENLKELEVFIINNKKLPCEYKYINNIKQKCFIEKWLLTQKYNYKNKQHIMKDEEIRKQWEEFMEKYKELF